MSIMTLQAGLEDAMQDFVQACQLYEDCIHPKTMSLLINRAAHSARCDELDADRKEHRRTIRTLVAQIQALPGGQNAVTEARRRLDAWARTNGYQDMLRIYEPLA